MNGSGLSGAQGWGLTVLRVVVGVVFLVHGVDKVFNLKFGGVAGFFAQHGIPAPAVAAVVVSLVEFLGGIALILGLFSRWVAIPIAIDMLVAILVVHLPNGFFVSSRGYEFTLLLLAASVALILEGGGELAVDNVIGRGRPAHGAHARTA